MNRQSRAANRQTWIERLDRFRRADQTVAQFCAEENVSVPSFYQWRRKLASGKEAVTPTPAQFVPVKLPPSEPLQPATVMSVELPGGVRVRFEVTATESAQP